MGSADLKAFVGEIIANQFDDIAIVFDNQDAFHGDRAHRTPAWRKCTVRRGIAIGIGKFLTIRELSKHGELSQECRAGR